MPIIEPLNFKKLLIILFIILCCSSLPAESTWMMTNRVHPELKWSTISTKHFNIHYHQGIEEIAKEGARFWFWDPLWYPKADPDPFLQDPYNAATKRHAYY